MKDKVVSVLVFSYNNGVEVKVTRAYEFNTRPTKVNVYSARREGRNAHRLVDLANKLNGLVLHRMVDFCRHTQVI